MGYIESLVSKELTVVSHGSDCLVVNLQREILANNVPGKPVTVGLGGLSALGKTTLAHYLTIALPSSTVLGTDSYMLDRLGQDFNFRGFLDADVAVWV